MKVLTDDTVIIKLDRQEASKIYNWIEEQGLDLDFIKKRVDVNDRSPIGDLFVKLHLILKGG